MKLILRILFLLVCLSTHSLFAQTTPKLQLMHNNKTKTINNDDDVKFMFYRNYDMESGCEKNAEYVIGNLIRVSSDSIILLLREKQTHNFLTKSEVINNIKYTSFIMQGYSKEEIDAIELKPHNLSPRQSIAATLFFAGCIPILISPLVLKHGSIKTHNYLWAGAMLTFGTTIALASKNSRKIYHFNHKNNYSGKRIWKLK